MCLLLPSRVTRQYGDEFHRHWIYKFIWQAGLICTLVGLQTIDAKNSITAAVNRVLFARSQQFALAA